MLLGHLPPDDRIELLKRNPDIQKEAIDTVTLECSQIRTQRLNSLSLRERKPRKPCDLFSFLNRIKDVPAAGLADLY